MRTLTRRLHAKWIELCGSAWLLLWCLAPNAQPLAISSGTTAIAKWDNNKIIVVTDSKATRTGGHRNADCKIAILNDNFFIASTGIRDFDVKAQNGLWAKIDSQETARSAFKDSRPQ